jgi:hypothetical protein
MENYAVKIPKGSPVYPDTEKDWFQFPFIFLGDRKEEFRQDEQFIVVLTYTEEDG